MAQMPVVEEGAEPPPYFPRTPVTLRVDMQPGTLRVPLGQTKETLPDPPPLDAERP